MVYMQVSPTNSPISRNATFFSLHYGTGIDNLFVTLNLVVSTVVYGLDPSYLFIYLPEPKLYVGL